MNVKRLNCPDVFKQHLIVLYRYRARFRLMNWKFDLNNYLYSNFAGFASDATIAAGLFTVSRFTVWVKYFTGIYKALHTGQAQGNRIFTRSTIRYDSNFASQRFINTVTRLPQRTSHVGENRLTVNTVNRIVIDIWVHVPFSTYLIQKLF